MFTNVDIYCLAPIARNLPPFEVMGNFKANVLKRGSPYVKESCTGRCGRALWQVLFQGILRHRRVLSDNNYIVLLNVSLILFGFWMFLVSNPQVLARNSFNPRNPRS